MRVPCYRRWCDAGAVRRIAVTAERAGFDALFVQDHVVAPVDPALDLRVEGVSGWMSGEHPGASGAGDSLLDYYAADDWWLDPFTTWAFLAAVTERITLASDIIVVPYRNPLVQAKMLATIDVLSEGRLLIGTGTGHVSAEFAALGVDWDRRGRLHDEYLRIIGGVLSQEEISHSGETLSFGPTRTLIRTVQDPRPPIFVGGNGRRAIQRAVDHGDGWLPSNVSPAELRVGLDALESMVAAAERSTPVRIAVSLPRAIKLRQPGVPAGRQPPMSADEVVDLCSDYDQSGVELVALGFPMPSLDVYIAQLEAFAQDVLPQLAEGGRSQGRGA